jgi:hypothetical protein
VFTLDSSAEVTEIHILVDTTISGGSLQYSLLGSAGGVFSSGAMTKGSCDPYQKNWCDFSASLDLKLPPGTYTVKSSAKATCSNVGSNNVGFISVLGCGGGPAKTPDAGCVYGGGKYGSGCADAPVAPTCNATLFDNGNTAACATPADTSTFTLSTTSTVTTIRLWENTTISGQSVSYQLLNSSGTLLSSGPTSKGGCDTYQTNWCEFLVNMNMTLPPGSYTVKSSAKAICANSGSNDLGQVIVRGCAAPSPLPDAGTGETRIVEPSRDGGIVVDSSRDGGIVVDSSRDGGIVVDSSRDGGITVDSSRDGGIVVDAPTSPQDGVAGALTITDYFPTSGTIGTTVILKLGTTTASLPKPLHVTYNEKRLADDSVLADLDTLRITVPGDAKTGPIRVTAGDLSSNAVTFTVLSPSVTLLTSATVAPSTTEQVVSYGDEISLTIPPGILDSTRTVSISRIENAPGNTIDPYARAYAYDVSIDGLEQLNGYVQIKVKYDPALLNPAYSAAAQLLPLRWNETDGYWLPLAYKVDTAKQTLSIYTDHLTVVEWLVLGAVNAVKVPVDWARKNLTNDVFVTPEGNVRILYGKDAIQGDAILNDSTWTSITYRHAFYPLASYLSDHPKFIQDIGHLLETALQTYVGVNKFKNPVPKPEEFGGNTANPINVKIDSWYVALGDNPFYDKIWETIHYPTIFLKDFESDLAYASLAHELFHRVQAAYYGRSGFLIPGNHWWIEASAEYAGYRVAWPGHQLNNMHAKTGYDFLSYPLTKTGMMPDANGWNLQQSYEYAASAFIQFLVEKKGLNFKDLTEQVVKGNPLEQLNGYSGLTLPQCYRDFAAWGIFGSDSFLARHSIATIAERTDKISVPSGKVKVSFTGGNYSTVAIIKTTKEHERSSDVPAPLRTIAAGESHEFDVASGNFLYLLASNTGAEAETLYVKVELMVDGKAEPGATHTFELQGSYSAKLWAIETQAPLSVGGTNQDETYCWNSHDFSDRVTTAGGQAPFEYSIVSGSLCPGLTLASGTGLISGTLLASNTNNCSFTIQVKDGLKQTATVTLEWSFRFCEGKANSLVCEFCLD